MRYSISRFCDRYNEKEINEATAMPLNIRSFSDMAREGGDNPDGVQGGGYDPTDTSDGAPRSFSEYAYSKRTAPQKINGFGTETFIYHEIQESALCGQHALNNLLQAKVFTEMDLAEVAQMLDAQEATLGLGSTMPGQSSNVDSTGNFSIQVLRAALQRSNNIELVTWSEEVQKTNRVNPLQEDGFIVNRREHWFAVRKIGARWYNLNSTIERPEYINDSSLVNFMGQLRADGFMVFIPTRGMLPKGGILPAEYDPRYEGKYWLKESDILNPTTSGAKPAVTAFSGKANRLVDKPPSPISAITSSGGGGGIYDEFSDPDLEAAIAASLGQVPPTAGSATESHRGDALDLSQGGDDFERDLAQAIALSKQESVASGSGGGGGSSGSRAEDKESAREKRLAALARRGL